MAEEQVFAIFRLDDDGIAGHEGGVHRAGFIVGDAVDDHDDGPGARGEDELSEGVVVGIARAVTAMGASAFAGDQEIESVFLGWVIGMVVQGLGIAAPGDRPFAGERQLQAGGISRGGRNGAGGNRLNAESVDAGIAVERDIKIENAVIETGFIGGRGLPVVDELPAENLAGAGFETCKERAGLVGRQGGSHIWGEEREDAVVGTAIIIFFKCRSGGAGGGGFGLGGGLSEGKGQDKDKGEVAHGVKVGVGADNRVG